MTATDEVLNAVFVSRPNVKHGKAIFCFIYKQVIARVTGNTKPGVGGLLDFGGFSTRTKNEEGVCRQNLISVAPLRVLRARMGCIVRARMQPKSN